VLTDRDRALVRAAWSLGLATHETLRLLVSPQTRANTLRRRLCLLHRDGYLTQTRHLGRGGAIWLYGAGPRALVPGEPRPWRPSVAQLEHTLAVGDVLVSLTRPRPGVGITGWQGEAELRAWAAPGAPYPDARVTWEVGGARGAWLVEVDRATESHAAWRRKLVRYLAVVGAEQVLAVTTTPIRAKAIASLAAEVGVDLVATCGEAVAFADDPTVFDARTRRVTTLAAAALGLTALTSAATCSGSRGSSSGPSRF
jgi:hypothetical protein